MSSRGTTEGLWGFVRVTASAIEFVRDDPREVLGSLEAGESWIPVEVEVDGATVRVRSGAADVERVLPATLSGPWGLLADGEGWIEWRAVRTFPHLLPADTR